MTPDQFVAALIAGAYRPAVDGVLAQAAAPSGRRPPDAALALAAWYRDLPAHDRAHVAQLVRQGAHAALFGMLAMLDGARAVDDVGGRLELRYVATDGTRTLLTPSPAEPLHDHFQSAVWHDVFGPTAA